LGCSPKAEQIDSGSVNPWFLSITVALMTTSSLKTRLPSSPDISHPFVARRGESPSGKAAEAIASRAVW
jgi:hypothetical protein